MAFFAQMKAGATKSATGLVYNIYSKGSGKKPAAGSRVAVLYSGYLENGIMFDSNSEEVAKAYGKYDLQRAAQGGYSPIPYEYGSKGRMIPGFEEGLSKLNSGDKAVLFIPSNLAYGENGAGNVIPPNASLIFEVQLLDK